MGDLSRNLSWSEVLRGSGYNSLDEVPQLLRDAMQVTATDMFQVIRTRLAKPIIILAGGALRSEEMNERCGGAPKSQHLFSKALDMRCKDPADTLLLFGVCEELQSSGAISKGGLSLYITKAGKPRFVHCDRRGRRARWGTKNRSRVRL